jgi:short chain dehydrogenase
MTQKTWLITGSGNGLGRNIAEAALAAGDTVVAGARRPEELAPLVAQYGERVKPVTLEVREETAAKAAVQLAVDTFGRLDVLVNNAGYGRKAANRRRWLEHKPNAAVNQPAVQAATPTIVPILNSYSRRIYSNYSTFAFQSNEPLRSGDAPNQCTRSSRGWPNQAAELRQFRIPKFNVNTTGSKTPIGLPSSAYDFLLCFDSMVERGGRTYHHHRNDPIVRAVDQVVQIAGRDGPEYG